MHESTAAIERGTVPPLLALSEVNLTASGRRILEDIDLAVHPREIVTLIGPNGAGKTTLVKLALGLLAPDKGRIERRPGLKIGYVPQHISIDPVLPLTVGRFLTLALRAPRDAVHAALERVGVAAIARSPVQSISGGEMRRVLLARALLRDVDLLVLDEPTQGVDVIGQGELYKLVSEIRDERGCGVLIVSHDLHLVMAATDHVVCLDHHVCCHGSPQTVRRDPSYLALFGHRAAEELAFYTHDQHAHEAGEKPS